jgi:hypothetical protein
MNCVLVVVAIAFSDSDTAHIYSVGEATCKMPSAAQLKVDTGKTANHFKKTMAGNTSSVCMESMLQATKTTYSGLQEHRINQYTATGQKAKPKEHMSTETTDIGHLSKHQQRNLGCASPSQPPSCIF